MSVSTIFSPVIQAGNGVTTVITVPWLFLANSDLEVRDKVDATGVETVLTITTHYTVSGAGVPAGGTVTMVTAPATGHTITVNRITPQVQASSYAGDGNLDLSKLEADFDKMVLLVQELQRKLNLCPTYRSTEASPTVDLGAAVDRANKLWGFDADGNFTVASDTGGSTAAAAASALAAQGYAADAAASEAAAVAAAASVNLPASPVAGDMLTHNGTAFTRLAKGTALQILRMNAGATSQEYFTMNLPPTPGAAGDIIYWNGSAWTKLAVGTALQVLRTNSGATAPEWASFSGDFSTGDFKLTLKTTADSGWVMCNDGTIGNGSSGGTTRANADTSALFTLLWNNVSNTYAPVSTGRGASAAADFAANKTIGLTKMLGRALAIAGAGSGLTSRVLGLNLGEETHTTPTAELPAHAHDQQISNAGASGAIADFVYWTGGGAVSGRLAPTWGAAESTGLAVATKNAGSGTPQNIMQPTSFVNIMLKL